MSSNKELALDSQEFQRIGEKISYCRRLLGLTQKELGQVTGISASYIAKIESGQCLAGLSLDLFFAICRGVNKDPIQILTQDPEDLVRMDIRNKIAQARRAFM
jgi:Predicted transcriptional regulator with C-terminal CBS domains